MSIDYSSMLLSIVIPVYNAGKTIHILVDELIAALDSKCILEIILVNDNSADNSEEACISIYEKYKKNVKFYSL